MLRRILLLITIIISALSTLGFAMQLSVPVQAPLNSAPQIEAIPNGAANEGTVYTVVITATDSDLSNTLSVAVDSGSMQAAASPTNGMVNGSGVLTAQLTISPTEADGAGSYPITVTVSDNDGPPHVVSTTFTLDVTEVNITPTIAAVGNQTVAEQASISVTLTVSDADLPANNLTVSAPTLPAGAVLITNTNSITWTPTEAQGPGEYLVVALVSDGQLAASTSFTITVTEVNVTPTITTIGDRVVNELTPLSIPISAEDTDIPTQTVTVTLQTALPTGAVFMSSTDTLSWTPSEAQGPGIYPVTVAATDGQFTVTQSFVVTVTEANEAPQIQAMSAAVATETVPISFTLIATDTDGPVPQPLTFTMSSQPVNSATIDATTGQFNWTPNESEGGATYTIQISVTDGSLTSSTSGQITVAETNITPTLSIADQTIEETMLLSFTLNGADGDLPGDTLIYSIPASTTASAELDPNSGLFQWTPGEGDGNKVFTVTADLTDGAATISDSFIITVTDTNVTPTIEPVADQRINELTLLSLPLTIADTDIPTDTLSVTFQPALPAGALFISNTNTITWTPTEAQGPITYPLTILVSDGSLTATETFTVRVDEVNLAPDLQAMSSALITESVPFSFTLIATDTDHPMQALTFTMSSQPTSTATIDATTGQFDWTPTETEGGMVYDVVVFVTDGVVTVSTSAVLTVVETNEPPNLSLMNQSITETVELTVMLKGIDADVPSDTLSYTIVASSTASAELDANTGLFRWTPGESDGGKQFTVTVRLFDGTVAVTDTFTIDVIENNVAPMFNPLAAQQITETHRLTFTLTATDTDDPPNAAITMTFASITPSASMPLFTPSTGVFDWTPVEVDGPQRYTATFVVTDGEMTGTLDVPIDVFESNLTPTLAAIPAQSITETLLLSFTLQVTDPDLPENTFSYMLESNVATSAEISNATGIFNWYPSDALGTSVVTFTVTVADGGGLTDTQTFTVTVFEASVPPVLAAATVEISETVQLNFVVPGSDIDIPEDTLTYTLVASSTDSAEFDAATHTFTWTPTELQGGQAFTATFSLSDGTFTVTRTYTITVIETNVAPQFLPLASQQVSETVELTFTLAVTDADIPLDTLSISLGSNAPAGATVDANSGLFRWTPGEADGPGVVMVTFVVSDGVLTSTLDVPITVFEINQPPILPAVISFVISETMPFSTVIVAADADLPANLLTYTVISGLPSHATFITDTLYWTPSEEQGNHFYSIIVEVTDGYSTDQVRLNITVLKANSAPVIPQLPLQRVGELATLNVTVSAYDTDVPIDTLTYSLINPPSGATIHPSTGVFNWPSVLTGTTFITVSVLDNGVPPLSSTMQFTIETGLHSLFIPAVMKNYSPLSNGGFESGSLTGWQTSGAMRAGIATAIDLDGTTGSASAPPISGTYSAVLGDPNYGTNQTPVGFGEMRRTISIPGDATKLKLQYRIVTHDRISGTGGFFDTFEVYVNNATVEDDIRNIRCKTENTGLAGDISRNLVLCDGNSDELDPHNPAEDLGLKSAEIDISAVAGTNIELILRVYNRIDRFYNTWVYLDSIEVVRD